MEMLAKNKSILQAVVVLVACLGSFLLGKNYYKNENSNSGIVFSCSEEVLNSLSIPKNVTTLSSSKVTTDNVSGAYFGSKNGTKYYPNGCANSRIKPENIIWFNSASDAQLQGYSRSSSC